MSGRRYEGVQILAIDGVEELDCGGTDNEASDIFELSDVVKIGLELTAVSGGTVDILVQLQVSNSKTLSTFAVETGYSDLINLVNTTRYRKTILDAAIPGFKYGRIFADGQGSNASGNTLIGLINLIRGDN